MNLFTKQKQTARHRNNLMVTKGKGGEVKIKSLGDTHYHREIDK